jgi:hypothetical protein
MCSRRVIARSLSTIFGFVFRLMMRDVEEYVYRLRNTNSTSRFQQTAERVPTLQTKDPSGYKSSIGTRTKKT